MRAAASIIQDIGPQKYLPNIASALTLLFLQRIRAVLREALFGLRIRKARLGINAQLFQRIGHRQMREIDFGTCV